MIQLSQEIIDVWRENERTRFGLTDAEFDKVLELAAHLNASYGMTGGYDYVTSLIVARDDRLTNFDLAGER